MRSLRHPVGPLSAATYWRRRILLIAVLLLVIAGIVVACRNGDEERSAAEGAAQRTPLTTISPTDGIGGPAVGPDGPGVSPVRSGTGTTTGTSGAGSPTAPATGGPAGEGGELGAVRAGTGGTGGTCAADALRLSVRTDQDDYAPAEKPRISLQLVNIGAGPCRVDRGPAAFEVTIYSGQDRIWSEEDCETRPSSSVVVLEPGVPQVRELVWDRRRSAEGCPADQPLARAGGEYRVLVTHRIAGQAEPERFTLE